MPNQDYHNPSPDPSLDSYIVGKRECYKGKSAKIFGHVERHTLVMHKLIPTFTTAHKRKHDQRICDASIILVVVLSRTPLR